ncbi:MAG: DUF503 domain-containing protein [Acidobacteria bacterium]|nr:MAG: DUF503 domain-containing protein [Acidobacteriota bacterium]REK00202.1 MAG: DUF503 domain-containing protein [Acidobacteriota bacterium]
MSGAAALVLFELHLPETRGLKEKRRIVKSLIERLHSRHRVSVAEVGLHDLHQRSEIGLALVASSASQAEALLESLRQTVELETLGCVISRWSPEVIDFA